ncbi:ATP-binding cassette domain-containing protein [Cellulomonas sp. P24]|uniref:ATP-binding cassette domain-containing protein n=1 Tax=Cellulomonas sp. P24 TaxID=2885206 RepID=UPI00216AE8FF|nr:ATP-binding cassette domain-containing protein [Cellulomonas sp. P24]MCR6492393.1 ATP-binding cassette domain-containing protein [Cellulomonas sp. P24]
MDDTSMIRLDRVTKIYPGSDVPAVEELTLDVRKGEILVLVGPSGCGKSTTLRLINRMIEPSGGHLYFDGEDVTKVNPDHLRRRIGYVIQQIGLFPHHTIAENIATVPKMLGWEKKRISARVDELLDIMGLEPSEYRNRYPKELSGGQAQRVGVARALGADPDVMLMDEPFGAIDPITRDRLQNEFLRLQGVLGKTIVFVTHDIDEAIKMGDRIAILGERSAIRQIDTPERILALPVDDFVDDFIGSGSTLKGLHFERVSGLDLKPYPTMTLSDPVEVGQSTLRASGREWLLLLDGERRPVRWLRAGDLSRGGGGRDLLTRGQHVRSRVEENATLHDTLEEMLKSSTGRACVVDPRGRFVGAVEINHLTEVIRRLRDEAQAHYDALEASS